MTARVPRVPTAVLTGTGLLLALGVVLPLVFHAFPLGGRIFLPMHIPTFVAGLVLGPTAGVVVGAGSPIVSALATGRPTVLYMVPMVFELATYGLVSGLLRRRFGAILARRTRGSEGWAAVTLALVCAMVAGRAVWLAVIVWLAPVVGLSARTVAAGLAALGAGWIGMAIQIVLIPPVVRGIERLRTP
jgi:hypothetical protein